MKNVQEVLDQKEAHVLQLLREVEALRIAARLLAEDAYPGLYNVSSAAVASADQYNVSNAQQSSPADADPERLSDLDLEPLSDLDKVILDDP